VKKLIRACLCGAALLFAAYVLAGDAFAQQYRVTSYRYERIGIFSQEEKGFARVAKVPRAELPPVPAAVTKVSPRGYVAVQGSDGVLWFEETQVVIEPPLRKVTGGCDRTVISRTSQAGVFGERGAGENDCE